MTLLAGGRLRETALLGAAVIGLAGCGGSATATRSATVTDAASGRVLFTQACSACHSLSGHDDLHLQGGDLLDFHSTAAQLRQFAAEMPVRRPLTSAELRRVVKYVMRAEDAAR